MNEESVCSSENLAGIDPNTEERECLQDRRSLFENVTACFCCFQGRGPGRKKKRSGKNENHYFATGSQGDEKVNQKFRHNEDDWHTEPLGEPGCGDASTPLCAKQGNTEVQDKVITVHNSEETQMQEHLNLLPQHIEPRKYKDEKQECLENLWRNDGLEGEEQEVLKHRSTELKSVDHKEENYHHVPNKEEQQFTRPKYHSILSLRIPNEKEQQKGQNHPSSKSDKMLVKKREDYPSIQNSKQHLSPQHMEAFSLAVTYEQEPLLTKNLINIHSRTAVYKEEEGITKKEQQPETPEHPTTLYKEQTCKKEKETGQDHMIPESTCIPSTEGQQHLGPESLNTLFLGAIYDKTHQKREKDESFESDNAPYRENHEVSSMVLQQPEGLEYLVLSLGVTCEEKQDCMNSKSQDALSNEEWDFSDAPKEKVDQGIAGENLSTFSISLISETQNQEQYHTSSESQDLHIEETFNYESMSNMRVQCMEQEPNLLPVEVNNETEQQGQNQEVSDSEKTFCKEKQNYHYVPHREAQQPVQPEYLSNLSGETAFQDYQKLEGHGPVSSEILYKVFEKVPNVEEPQAMGAEDCNTSPLLRTCENEMQVTEDHSNRRSLTDFKEHKQQRQHFVRKMFFISSSDEETEQDEYDDLIVVSQEQHEEEKDLQKTISQSELGLEEPPKIQEPFNTTHLWVSQDMKEEQNLLHVLLEPENKQQDAQDSPSLRSPDVPCKNKKVDKIQVMGNTAILCDTYNFKEHKEGITCEETEDH